MPFDPFAQVKAAMLQYGPAMKWATCVVIVVIALVAAAPELGNASQEHTKAQRHAAESYPDAVEEAQRNIPPSGYASLYVLRPSRIPGIAVCWFVNVDGKAWGGLANGQYSWDPLPPGEHIFTRANKKGVSVTAEPGNTYYVVVSAGGIGGGGVALISPEAGEKMRKKLSLNPDRWLLRQYVANWSSLSLGISFDEAQQRLRFSEGQFAFLEGTKLDPIVIAPNGSGIAGIVGTGREMSFRSMLGYRLTFKPPSSGSGYVLSEKTDGLPAGVDTHGCPAPTPIGPAK